MRERGLFDIRPGEDHRRLLPVAGVVRDIVLWRDATARPGEGRARASIPQRLVHHSPDGFEWGYLGSGPSDLALNILALFVDPPEAFRLHTAYKFDVVAHLPHDGGTVTARSVLDWIAARWLDEDAEAARLEPPA
jgi:hypothetical protein